MSPNPSINEITQQKLLQRMEAINLREEDIDEQFIRGSGKGGQKINKTSSCVQLIHRPTGIIIKCQKHRSQAMNRFFARRELCERLEEKTLGIQSKRQQQQEKIRRQKRRRSRRQKEHMLNLKKQQSQKKQRRRSIDPNQE